jgi:hypothetical protein
LEFQDAELVRQLQGGVKRSRHIVIRRVVATSICQVNSNAIMSGKCVGLSW